MGRLRLAFVGRWTRNIFVMLRVESIVRPSSDSAAGGRPVRRRRLGRAGIALAALALTVSAFLGLPLSSAVAAQTRLYTGTSFGPDGVGGSEDFGNVQSVAVDPAGGDVYVYDVSEGGKIYKFDAS